MFVSCVSVLLHAYLIKIDGTKWKPLTYIALRVHCMCTNITKGSHCHLATNFYSTLIFYRLSNG